MYRYTRHYILIVLSFFVSSNLIAKKSEFALWEQIKNPDTGLSQSIGSYNAGCLMGGQKLPLSGIGYELMKPSRLRYYGHPNLVNFIETVAKQNFSHTKKKIMIGDMGRPRGGPMISGHVSHQSGLDVDVWYKPLAKKLSNKEREKISSRSYIKKNKLIKTWGKFQRALIRDAAQFDEVERIFVNAAVKKDLCKKFKGESWLFKVRAWYGHDDHMHIRLRCPNDSSVTCTAQEPLNPKNDQCGKELAWWFSKEAEEEWNKKQEQIAARIFPVLPKQCETLVDKGVVN